MSAIITDTFRRNASTLFYNDVINTANDSPEDYNGYYIGIGKSDPWEVDNNPPSPTNSVLERQDVIDNLITIQEIGSDNIFRLIPKTGQEWTTGRTYKRYDPTDPTCFEQSDGQYACYMYTTENDPGLYLCLSNNGGATSTLQPLIATNGLDATLSDGYIWVKIGPLVTGKDFEDSSSFLELPADQLSEVSPTETDTAGLIYGFKIISGGSGYTANSKISATLRGEYTNGNNATAQTLYFSTNPSGVVTNVVLNTNGDPIPISTLDGYGNYQKASIDFTTTPVSGSGAKVIPLIAPAKGFAYDNLEVFPPYYIGVSGDFAYGMDGEALTSVKFRQISIIKNIGTRTNNDSPNPTITTEILDSLSYLTLTSTPSLTVDSGWYLVDGSGNKAWIDQIDGTKVYYHQNSELGSTRGVISSSGSITIYNSSGTSQGNFSISTNTSAEHEDNTGEVIFIENRIPITRNTAQTEKVRIILQF